jgi:hypothetical protein
MEIAGRGYRVWEFRDDHISIDLEELRSPMFDDERFFMLGGEVSRSACVAD